MSQLHQCPECKGVGVTSFAKGCQECANCDGTGWLDEHGEPLYLEPETKELSKEAT